MNLGAFAGGVAKGMSQAEIDRARRSQTDRIEKEQAKQDAYEQEMASLAAKYSPAEVPTEGADIKPPAEEGTLSRILGIGDAPDQPQHPASPQVAAVSQGIPGGALAQPSQPVEPRQPQRPKSFADIVGYATEAINVKARHGMDVSQDMIKLRQLSDNMETEGANHALALAHAGNFDAMLDTYNRNGKGRFELQGQPERVEYEIAGQKVPGYRFSIKAQDGQVHTVNTAPDMFAKMSLDKQLAVMSDASKLQIDADYKNRALDAQISHQGATLDFQRDVANRKEPNATTAEFAALANIYGPDEAARKLSSKYSKNDRVPLTDIQRESIYRDAAKERKDDPGGPVKVKTGVKVTKENPWYKPNETVDEERDETLDEYIQRTNPGRWELLQGGRGQERSAPQSAVAPGPAGGIGRPSQNNQGNLRVPGSTTAFQEFNSPEEGLAALDKQLRIYHERDGLNTPRKILSKYAPPSENDTEGLIKAFKARTGIGADDQIDMANPAARQIVSSAIMLQEKGPKAFVAKGNGQGSGPQEGAGQPGQASPRATTGGLMTPEEVMKAAQQRKEARAKAEGAPSATPPPEAAKQPPTDAETMGLIAGKVGAGAKAIGRGALAVRDAGEKLGTTQWWAENTKAASAGWQKQLDELIKATNWTSEQIEQYGKQTDKNLDEIIQDFQKGYSSVAAK